MWKKFYSSVEALSCGGLKRDLPTYQASTRQRKKPKKKHIHNFATERRMLCILRESNPGQLLGRQLSYRWTKNA